MYNFREVEEKVANIWKKHDKAIKESLQYDPKKEMFSFLEGPPTANAPPSLHHVEVRIFKDLFCRFKHMQGYTVPRKGGWDCHGLPVEVQIEKKLGLNSKKDVVKYGISNFVKDCKESVFGYIKDWNKLTEKMGYWIDLENPYITLKNEYVESVWWSLKELYDKGLLYESHKVVPLCPRCETPLSTHEVAQGYKDVTEPTVVVAFKLKNFENRYMLTWTTTAWTLISNVGLAVHADLDYVIVSQDGKEYVLSRDLMNKYFDGPIVLDEIKGKDLKGLEYEPVFPYFEGKLDKPAWRVITADWVTTDEGTGIVHIAGAFGEVDYEACKENDLPFLQPVSEQGIFSDEVKDFKGQFVKDTDPDIILWLKKKGALFKTQNYTHTYPYCWRCNSPLLYYAMLSWFIKVTEVKDNLIKNNDKITWVPKHIKEGRFGKWLEGVKDWALSRKKFWGSPLPIWRCECGNEIAIGSIKELKEKSVKKIKEIELHKPLIDEVLLRCDKCKKSMKRVDDVIDCWYDSGASIFAQFHYPFENKGMFEKSFPYNFIAEAVDQTRGWFYTLHALGTMLFNKNAYDSVVCAGLLVDEKGEKMSKSKGNILDAWEAFDALGVDAVRLQFCATEPGDVKRFGVHSVNQLITPFLKILWNTYQFSKHIKLTKEKPGNLELEDIWIISKINSLVKEVTEDLEKHNYHKTTEGIMNFVNEDFSRWYIKLIRDRANQKDGKLGYVFHYVFERILKLLAPFAPYITDYIYNDLIDGKVTVHLENWPKEENINGKLEKQMEITRNVVTGILAQREKAQIGVRWPLKEALIVAKDDETLGAIKKLEVLIKLQTNIKSLKTGKKDVKEEFEIKLDTKLTPELEAEGFCREICRAVQALRKKAGLKKEDRIELNIASDYDLSKFEKEIRDKVGAKEVKLSKSKEEKEHSSEEKIKGKEFKIGFNLVK